MKRIWFTQQASFDYLPLRIGLGQIEEERLKDINFNRVMKLCPKIYTTRTHRLKGEYYVVRGSRYKAEPVLPRIEFKAKMIASFFFSDVEEYGAAILMNEIFSNCPEKYHRNSFAELDLGYESATFEELKNAVLNLNPTTTSSHTTFYVNRLEPCKECGE